MRRLAIRRNTNRRNAPANKTPINGDIRAKEVRLILPDGEQAGVVSLRDALEAAEEVGLDLVQISDADPIVCKVMDFGKKLYEEKKQKAAAKKNQVQTTVKEIKFRPNTDVGDYNIKLEKMKGFLEHGDKVKVTLRYRGREMAHQDIGRRLLDRIEGDLKEVASTEQRPKMEGRQTVMIVAPLKKK